MSPVKQTPAVSLEIWPHMSNEFVNGSTQILSLVMALPLGLHNMNLD
jgi:hypothetical protein